MKLSLDENLISKCDVIAVALSGGEDSMALLYALLELSKKVHFELKAINVEHGIRGDESLSDTNFCVEQCRALNIELCKYSVDAPNFSKNNSCSLEEAARILRYDCFQNALQNGFCNKIATAHHQSDVVETTLLNLFRGTGLSGAKGIAKTALNGGIIRPMLKVSKQKVTEYVDYYKIPFVHDSTNDSLDYSRNYLRNIIISSIKDRFPHFENSISRFCETAESDDCFLYTLAEEKVEKLNNKAVIPIDLPFPIFSRTAILAMKHVGITKDYTTKHLESLFSLCLSETGCEINLLGGVTATKEYDKIVLEKENLQHFKCIPFSVGEFLFGEYLVKIEESTEIEYSNEQKSTYSQTNFQNGLFRTLYISQNAIPSTTVIRTLNEGDIFKKFGGGSKSLKKYLTDLKIPKLARKTIPILCDETNCLAVFGIEISPDVKISCNDKVLKLTIKKFEV